MSATNTPGDADSIFRITQPGSYYLTGNVDGVAAKHGIEIEANDVTLDLMGYALSGVPGSLNGINFPGFHEAVVIRNGIVSTWDQSGVLARINNGAIEQVHTRRNGAWGIDNDGASATRIAGCSAFANGVLAPGVGGIRTGSTATVELCQAISNTGDGIVAGVGSIISGNAARVNTGAGIDVGDSSTVSGNTALNNGGDGIRSNSASSEATFTGNTATANGGDGIDAAADSTVTGNTAEANVGNGIVASTGSTVTGNSVNFSGGDGILAGIASTVSGNTATGNKGDGIQVTADSFVLNNTCDSNGFTTGDGAGIHVTSSDCVIDGNSVTDNDRGIDVDLAGNLIIRNSASGNTVNYDFVASNRYGPVINITAAGAVAVAGSVAASTVATTDPWANFAY